MAFIEGCPHPRGGLYEGFVTPNRKNCTKRVHLGLSEVAFIEGCPHVRGGLYEEFVTPNRKKKTTPPQDRIVLAWVYDRVG